MTISITFENATLQDLIKKVAAAAPTSGPELDQTPGVLIEYKYLDDSEDHDEVTFRATNGSIMYTEWAQPISVDGDVTSAKWLVSSNLIAAIAGALPIQGKHKLCTLSPDATGAFLELTSGNIRCRMPLNSRVDTYPEFGVFDPDTVQLTNGFADRINRVAWACMTGASIPLNGVHFDGENVVATDRAKMAITPFPLKIDEPFTVPSAVLAQLVKANGGDDTKAAYYNGRLLVMPNPNVQIQVSSYATEYVKYHAVMDHSQTHTFRVGKAAIVDVVSRVSSLVSKERIPSIQAHIGKGAIGFISQDVNGSLLRDVLEIPTFADHPRVLYTFTPAYLLASLTNAPGDEVEISYWADRKLTRRPHWHIASDGGYEVWQMTRSDEVPRKGDE